MTTQIILTAVVCFLTGVAVSYRAAQAILAGKDKKIETLNQRLSVAEGWDED